MTIRTAIAAVLGVLGLLLGTSMYVASVQLEAADDRVRAEADRTRSVALAESLRTSSNDLTRMVRLYAATGDDRYRRVFDRILAIRAGTAPRPRDYDQAYWDRVLDRGEGAERLGPPRSLVALMRDADFRPAELASLERALRTSDRLARTETEVIEAIRDAGVRPGDPQAAVVLFPQVQRLSDAAYHREKRRIMAAIDAFVGMVTTRTEARLQSLQDRERGLAQVQLGVLVTLGLLAAGLLTLGRVGLSAPILRLRDGLRELVADRVPGSSRFGPLRELREAGAAFEALVAQRAAAAEAAAEDHEAGEGDAAARPAGAVLPLVREAVDVRRLVEEAAAERGGAVAVDVDEDVPAVLHGNPEHLARVVDVLLDDAVGAFGEVTLLVTARRLYEDRHEVRLTAGSATYAWAADVEVAAPA